MGVGMIGGVLRTAWSVVRNPITGLAALTLLVGDCVWIAHKHGGDAWPCTTAGSFLHKVLHPGFSWSSCGGRICYLLDRTPDGMKVIDRGAAWYAERLAPAPLSPEVDAIAIFDRSYAESGFWAPTVADESQSFTSVDRARDPLEAVDEDAARRGVRDWFLAQGYPPGRFDPTRGDFARTWILWGGVAHTAAAGFLALLTLMLPWSAARVVAARRRAGLAARGLCVACEYDLAGVMRHEGVCVCPECGVGAEGLEKRRAA